MLTKEHVRGFVVGLLMASACWIALILLLKIQAVANSNSGANYPTEIYKK
jgi:hypothetical protein